jgi:hypothetical protein
MLCFAFGILGFGFDLQALARRPRAQAQHTFLFHIVSVLAASPVAPVPVRAPA